jgi:ABC-2 type transport system ATP-binding protein
MTASSLAVELKKVRKSYGSSHPPALDLDTLEITRNEFFGLLGPNGAGKTTLISLLCGILRADEGTINVWGSSPLGVDSQSIRGRMGYVPQNLAVYESLTGRENLHLFGQLYGLKKTVLRERTERLLARMGLTECADRRVSTYSGGMKRLINLGAGLLHEPDLIILDEPTVGIDTHTRRFILEILRELHAAGATLFFTTHYLDEAELGCSRIAVMERGKILAVGSPDELCRNAQCENLEQFFLSITRQTRKSLNDE